MEEYEIDYQFLSAQQIEIIESEEHREFIDSFSFIEHLEQETHDKACNLNICFLDCNKWKENNNGCLLCEHYTDIK